MRPLLEVQRLSIALRRDREDVPVVEEVSFHVRAGETLALVGESGSGKTLTALALLGVLPGGARVTAGRVLWRGADLLALSTRQRRALAGKELALSFQEPASALNPVLPVGEQVAEGLRHHAGMSRRAAAARTLELLAEVGLADAAALAARAPHELSGGQRQRVMLAVALACGPSLLIADEPTSALDAPVQAEVLRLLAALRARREMALLLITHDLGVVAELADRVAVLYAGRVVEEADVLELFERPRHPYTRGLLRSRPGALAPGERLAAIPGQVPEPGARPSGCAFRPRCERADDRCASDRPRLLVAARTRRDEPAEAAPGPAELVRPPDEALDVSRHRAACHYPDEEAAP